MSAALLRMLDAVTSLRLTIVCLAAGLVLVFAGTLAQVKLGIHEVQLRYFQSLLVWWSPSGSDGLRLPVFPGGHLIGGVLLVNLVGSHIRRFRWAWNKAGIQLAHFGLIVILAGGLFTDLFSVESHMRVSEGETKNYSEDPRRVELALVDVSDPAVEQVTTIPHERLERDGTIVHESLPFRIIVRQFFRNSHLSRIGKSAGGAGPAASQGAGAGIAVEGRPRATGINQRNVMSAVIEIMPLPAMGAESADSLGTWLVSDALAGAQKFSLAGRTWSIRLRPTRYYKPFSVTLLEFTHERYPGTQIPKNFSSRIRLVDPEESVDREVLIYMNHPLRYRGDTFYQSGFNQGGKMSILQVVRNPTFIAPYVGCVIVGGGLLLQFSLHLFKFARRRAAASTA